MIGDKSAHIDTMVGHPIGDMPLPAINMFYHVLWCHLLSLGPDELKEHDLGIYGGSYKCFVSYRLSTCLSYLNKCLEMSICILFIILYTGLRLIWSFLVPNFTRKIPAKLLRFSFISGMHIHMCMSHPDVNKVRWADTVSWKSDVFFHNPRYACARHQR